MDMKDIVKEFDKNEFFYRNGGITVTGGEALVQMDKVYELFKIFKEKKVHTCLDTSGYNYSENEGYLKRLDALLSVTDLILLDIKHIDDLKHRELVGITNKNILNFARYISKKNIPVWIRHVILTGYTYNEDYLYKLGYFLGELTNIKALDILPYHTMGTNKYVQLNLKYPLEGVMDATKDMAKKARNIVINGMRDRRNNLKQAK